MRVLITALGLCLFSFLAGVAGDLSMSAEAAPQIAPMRVAAAHVAVPRPLAIAPLAVAPISAPCSIAVSVVPAVDLLAPPAALTMVAEKFEPDARKFAKRV